MTFISHSGVLFVMSLCEVISLLAKWHHRVSCVLVFSWHSLSILAKWRHKPKWHHKVRKQNFINYSRARSEPNSQSDITKRMPLWLMNVLHMTRFPSGGNQFQRAWSPPAHPSTTATKPSQRARPSSTAHHYCVSLHEDVVSPLPLFWASDFPCGNEPQHH